MSNYSSQEIQQWEGKELKKVLEYLTNYLPATFSHPDKTMEACDMLSFLCGVLQVYLEFWNSSAPFEEYTPDFRNHLDVCKMIVHI